MSDEVHEAYIRQLLEAHKSRRSLSPGRGASPPSWGWSSSVDPSSCRTSTENPGTLIENTFQTNGILLNEDWCRFFRENNFLIGLSLDGPKELHDFYRKDRGGQGTFDRVVRARGSSRSTRWSSTSSARSTQRMAIIP